MVHPNITGERDIEWFSDYPAPIMENIHSQHFTIVNSTIPFFGPMLYFLVRQFGCEQILEIGHAEGYSSFYLANGVKDNGTRYRMAGNKFYAIDIVQTEKVREMLLAKELPVVIEEKDSMTLTKDDFPEVNKFDMIFQDGNHDTEHVVYEFETMWSRLKDKGDGYWIAHDAQGPAEEGCREIIRLLKERNEPVQYLTMGGAYGLLIIRKMANLDPEKRFWTD